MDAASVREVQRTRKLAADGVTFPVDFPPAAAITALMTTSTYTSLRTFCCFLAVAPVSLAACGAENDTPVDKSQFHLFNPTPAKYLREMSTDRPDKTESPYTVDAGHFQFEMDFLNYAADKEKSGGVTRRIDALAVAPINLKIGLCNRSDLQLVLEPYNHVYERTENSRETRQGFGNTTLRYKYNFWGNDGGRTAFAAMPYVRFPTSQDGLGRSGFAGGLILPLAVQLPHEFNLGVMSQFDAARDEEGDGHHAAFVNTITVGHDIIGRLAGYAEFFSYVSTERGSKWAGTFDLGLTYGITANIQFDAGVNIGVTESAPDWNPFVGLSMRF
jgi:hypothetical protein